MLGIVLAPYGKLPDGNYPYNITMSRGSDQTHYLGPLDPQFYSSGEAGYYYDTPLGAPPKMGLIQRWRLNKMRKRLGLGAIPTDDEMAYNRGYTPVESAWVATTNQGDLAPPWNPPDGWLQMGAYGPRSAPMPPGTFRIFNQGLSGLGADAGTAAGAQAVTTAVEETLSEHQARMFKLTLFSTVVVALSATLATWRTWKQLKRDEELFSKRLHISKRELEAE